MDSWIIGVEVSCDKLVDSWFGGYFCSKVCVCGSRVRTEKKRWPVSRGTGFRLLDFLVIIFEIFFMIGEVVLHFGDLEGIISKMTLRLQYIFLWYNASPKVNSTNTALINSWPLNI
jgi:hypothetical protein